MESLSKLLEEFLSKDPYKKLRPTMKIKLQDLIRALNWASFKELLDTFYELGLDKTLQYPRSAVEVAHEHYIVDIKFLKAILDSLVKMGILDEATGRYKLRFFQRKPKKPPIVDELRKTPLIAVFDIIHMMGENIVDVLMTGQRELDWIKDAAIAFEPLEFSPQFVMLRFKALDLLMSHLKTVFRVLGVKKPQILVIGLASGFGLLNVAMFFRNTNISIIALDPSEREAKLADELLNEFGLNAEIDIYDISKRLSNSNIIKTLKRKTFDAVIVFEKWRFYESVMRLQILTNIAYSMTPYSSIVDFDLTKEDAFLFDTILHTIKGWQGFLYTDEKRSLYGLVFQRLKERSQHLVIRADLPLVKGEIL